ncbi:hypothetical protein DAEQUDRAFT_251156 [Daedalea quercina L-15889]|uniref:Uncharacterized protein n=1 Tax=Daedalea quercina L-15889 TaxID=1314783 RepID=A0A165QNR1_9APHY|nr:hypothetical protein DAEQUDRAFT_251156 [Daedalea quercina L-15889]
MDDWNAFQRDLVVCRSDSYGGRVNSGVNIQSRNAFMIPDVRSAFDVTIHLPAGTPSSPVQLQSIFAHIQDFEVSIDDLQDRVTFNYFSLNSMNMPVHAGSLVARRALYIHSSNAPISGSFKAIGITLDAANGEITANASVASERDVHLRRTFLRPSVRLSSTNRAIAANVSLDGQATVGGNVQVEARTTNAPIDLAIAAPETARMAVSTHNQFAPTRVALPDTYVGDFALYTMRGWQQPVVHFDREHDGRGRAMRVSSFSDHRVSGDVRGPGSPPPTRFDFRNRVSMSAQNGDLDLYL